MILAFTGARHELCKVATEKFAKQKPMAVMARVLVANALSAETLDSISSKHRDRQFEGELSFSTVADIQGIAKCINLKKIQEEQMETKKQIETEQNKSATRLDFQNTSSLTS